MSFALLEIRRAALKYGLLAAAVALLVFLVLFLWTLSGALIRSFIGTLEAAELDVVVYSAQARDNVQASRLEPDVVAAVAAVDGVSAAAPWSTTTLTGELDGEPSDLGLFGIDPQGPGAPAGLTDGRLPTALDETAVDAGGQAQIGDLIVLRPSGIELKVVGLLRGAQFLAQPTAFVDQATFDEVTRAANPEVPFVPINAVAVTADAGTDPGVVAQRVEDAVPGVTAYTKRAAVDAVPGVDQVGSTFVILIAVTFLIAVVVVGFFFLILTVQKQRVFTLLRALGDPPHRLAAGLALQITAVVAVASVVAVGVTALAIAGLNTGIPVSLSPQRVAIVVAAVLAFSLLAGMVSVSRIARLDPAAAAGAR